MARIRADSSRWLSRIKIVNPTGEICSGAASPAVKCEARERWKKDSGKWLWFFRAKRGRGWERNGVPLSVVYLHGASSIYRSWGCTQVERAIRDRASCIGNYTACTSDRMYHKSAATLDQSIPVAWDWVFTQSGKEVAIRRTDPRSVHLPFCLANEDIGHGK